MKTLLIALLGFASLCSAETAPTVVALSSEDAATVKSVRDELLAAQQHWENVQKQIGLKYLVVAKDSADASDKKWYAEGLTFFRNWYTTGQNIISGDLRCETPEEKTARLSMEAKIKTDQENAMAEREANSKRIHKGFDSESDFEFSDDWKFLVKKHYTPPADNGSRFMPYIPTTNLGTMTQ